MAWLTVNEVRERLRIDDVGRQDELQRLASAAQDAAERYLDRVMETQTYTDELYDGTGETWLLLNEWPAAVPTKVEWYLGYPDQWQLMTPLTDYLVEPKGKRLLVSRNYPFSCGDLNWRLTYTAGYAAGAVPSSIVEGAKLWLAEWYRRMDKQLEGVTQVNLNNQTLLTITDGPSKAVRQLLDPYRRHPAAPMSVR